MNEQQDQHHHDCDPSDLDVPCEPFTCEACGRVVQACLVNHVEPTADICGECLLTELT